MEDRIRRMESAISISGIHGTTEPTEVKEADYSSSDQIESQAGLSNHLSNLVLDPDGTPNFIGIRTAPIVTVGISALTLLFRLGLWILTSFPTRTSMDLGKVR